MIQVAKFLEATSQLAQTTLRAVLGKHELDELLVRARAAQPRHPAGARHADRRLGHQGVHRRDQARRPQRVDGARDRPPGRGRARAARQDHPRRGRAAGLGEAAAGGADAARSSRRRCSCATCRRSATSPATRARPSCSRCRSMSYDPGWRQAGGATLTMTASRARATRAGIPSAHRKPNLIGAPFDFAIDMRICSYAYEARCARQRVHGSRQGSRRRRARSRVRRGRALLRACCRSPRGSRSCIPSARTSARCRAIVAATGATQTNVSRHLSLMLQAGVVSRRRDGNAVYYRVADREFVEICRSVCVQIAGRIDEQKPLKQGPAAVRRAALAIQDVERESSRRPRHHLTAPPDPARRSLLRRGAVLGGALAAGAQARADDGLDEEPAAERSRVEPHARRTGPRVALRRAVEVRGERHAPRKPRAHAHAAVVGGVHAAAEPVRHHHAVGTALRAPSRRHAARSTRISTG